MEYNDIMINIIIIIIGLIIGIIFGFLLFKEYIYKGPDSNIVSEEIYSEKNGKKFKWIPNICICPINLSMGKLSDPNYIDPNH
jgi:hypothetical protein